MVEEAEMTCLADTRAWARTMAPDDDEDVAGYAKLEMGEGYD